jgi:hypothetical protein
MLGSGTPNLASMNRISEGVVEHLRADEAARCPRRHDRRGRAEASGDDVGA